MLQVAVQMTPYVTMHPTSFLYTHRAAGTRSAFAKVHLALPTRVVASRPSLSQFSSSSTSRNILIQVQYCAASSRGYLSPSLLIRVPLALPLGSMIPRTLFQTCPGSLLASTAFHIPVFR